MWVQCAVVQYVCVMVLICHAYRVNNFQLVPKYSIQFPHAILLPHPQKAKKKNYVIMYLYIIPLLCKCSSAKVISARQKLWGIQKCNLSIVEIGTLFPMKETVTVQCRERVSQYRSNIGISHERFLVPHLAESSRKTPSLSSRANNSPPTMKYM